MLLKRRFELGELISHMNKREEKEALKSSFKTTVI